MTSPLLEVKDLGKRFGGFSALSNVNLSVERGERVGLIGPNGSGKSTFVNCLCGALRHETGTIEFDGRPMLNLPPHQRTRHGMARSFQLPRPFVSLTLAQNLRIPSLYAAAFKSGKRPSEEEIQHRCAELLRLVGLLPKASKRPNELTQVEMRKAELARAMATDPKLLIADEAMAGLSNAEVDEILRLMFTLNERGITIIFIEHIMRAVMQFSERLVVLMAGQKIADGLPLEVIRHPEVERAYLGQ
jgi:branched-chain amino acid transport system ATP-binding protein